MLQVFSPLFNCKSIRSEWFWLFSWVFGFIVCSQLLTFLHCYKTSIGYLLWEHRGKWRDEWVSEVFSTTAEAEGSTSLQYTASNWKKKKKKQYPSIVQFRNQWTSHTLLFSVATVALILFAERSTIFSLVNPKNMARGWCREGFLGNNKTVF